MKKSKVLMSQIQMKQLYNDEWKKWAKAAKSVKTISPPFETIHCVNRSCGDTVDFSIKVQNYLIKDIGFDAEGCSICLGTTAFLSNHLNGMSVNQAILELQKIEEIVENGELKEENSPLNLFNLIADFPTRLNCVLLETKNLLNFLKAI